MRRWVFVSVLMCGLAPHAVFAQDEPAPATPPLAPGFFAEPAFLTNGFDLASRFQGDDEAPKKDGFYPIFKSGVTGAGWIAAGPGYRRHLFDGRAALDTSASVSWRGYKTAQASFELVRLAGGRAMLGSQVLWQDLTQLQYFGLGPDSLLADRSDYRLKTTDVVGYGQYRPLEWLTIDARAGRLGRPTISSSTGPFDRDFRNAFDAFASEPGFDGGRQPAFLHGELSLTADTRDYPGHPTSGALYRTAISTYADRGVDAFGFRRYELEALQFVPVMPDRWTLALHGWTVASDAAGGQHVPVYLLPSLGGSSTLRSFADYRFHDRHLLLLSAESRWALFSHVDVAVFADAGSVAARFGDLNLSETSYGAGIRAHTRTTTLARFDVAHGREGWRLLFRLNEPFRLSRLARRMAAIPFIP
jgi:hypothetical protein